MTLSLVFFLYNNEMYFTKVNHYHILPINIRLIFAKYSRIPLSNIVEKIVPSIINIDLYKWQMFKFCIITIIMRRLTGSLRTKLSVRFTCRKAIVKIILKNNWISNFVVRQND